MNVLVFNCGSSSLKYSLLQMPEEIEQARGEAQRVGLKTSEPSRIVHRSQGRSQTVMVPMSDHGAAFDQVMALLERDGLPLPDVIGHRMVHGGHIFTAAATLLDDSVNAALDEIASLAPIHNPPAISLVRACRERSRELRQILVYDTSFHSTIPEHASSYALPRDLRVGAGLRKFGFHGISHEYVVGEAARLLSCPLSELNAVSCHLGSGGASLCALVEGKSADNTMGFSPLQGLLMSTRCGDLDPAVTLQLLARAGGDSETVESLLNKKSGVLGLAERSADIRDVLGAGTQAAFDETAQVYLWRIRKYLGSYLAVAAPAAAIIFTDTIGELVPFVRRALCDGLEAWGVEMDNEANEQASELPADIATKDSRMRVLVIATNEELAIARTTYRVAIGSNETEGETKWAS
ncbi:MAG: acetate/propionate family kinase [Polyangiaceae bacterium]|nr:acetate/propionate family kinase [Polyangiaceae bacterium]